MFESFITSKNNILSFVEVLKSSSALDQGILANSKLEQEMESLENGEFKIALIAPFSAGKSTFINSLIGQDLLSMEITAETSVITKVKYSENLKLEIRYRDGQTEMIPGEGEPALNVEELKEVLEMKTTVKGENTEDTIEEVKVYYPIEMCKDQVELVDTPGLFARHEKHKSITNNILPTVNAVIFMIDPESVGQVHFTEVIQNYVRNAEKSNMEEQGRHIFFVINKIDKFEKNDIQKARKELEGVLEEILPTPQIFEVSAYYAMLGKMFFAKTIELEAIKKDRKVVIPDPEDPEYTLSGRELKEQHVPLIIEESRIRELERGLEKYLEEKNEYLIWNVANQVEDVIIQSINQKEEELSNIREMAQIDKGEFEIQINKLSDEIDEIEGNEKRKILANIASRTNGTAVGEGLVGQIAEKMEDHIISEQKDLSKKIYKTWLAKRAGINPNNAEEILMGFVNQIENELDIMGKNIIKETFNELKRQIKDMLGDVEQDMNHLKIELEKAELTQVGKTFGEMDTYNLGRIMSTITKGIEESFSETVIAVASGIGSKVREAEAENTSVKERSGFLYKFKRFFTGAREYDKTFDINGFKSQIEGDVDEIMEMIASQCDELGVLIKELLQSPIQGIMKQVSDEVGKIINALINNKKALINHVIKAMKNSEKENEKRIRELEGQLVELEALREKHSHLVMEMEVSA